MSPRAGGGRPRCVCTGFVTGTPRLRRTSPTDTAPGGRRMMKIRRERTLVRRRRIALGTAAATLVAGGVYLGVVGGGAAEPTAASRHPAAGAPGPTRVPTAPSGGTRAASPTSPPTTAPARPASDTTTMVRRERITGDISPKSVVASAERPRRRPEHDVHAHPHGVPARRASWTRPSPTRSTCRAFGHRRSPGHLARCAGRGGVHLRRRARLRVQLLDVRRGVRPRGRSTRAPRRTAPTRASSTGSTRAPSGSTR